jgi:hypothetical protein
MNISSDSVAVRRVQNETLLPTEQKTNVVVREEQNAPKNTNAQKLNSFRR